MATAGKVAPTPKDKFVNGTAYDKLDVVEYNGTLYIAKKASAGVLPTDTEYWMLAVDLTGKLDTTGDTENNTVTFESSDEADPTEWKSVNVLASKEKHSSILNKISNMFSNIRYLYKNVGGIKGLSSSSAITTQGEYALDAREKNASIDGTLANELSKVNSNFDNINFVKSNVNNKIDPNTTTIRIIRTKHDNCPTSDVEYIIYTIVTDVNSEISEKRQIAFRTGSTIKMYIRGKAYNGNYSDWQTIL